MYQKISVKQTCKLSINDTVSITKVSRGKNRCGIQEHRGTICQYDREEKILRKRTKNKSSNRFEKCEAGLLTHLTYQDGGLDQPNVTCSKVNFKWFSQRRF